MICTVVHHQEAIEMFWLHFSGALMFIFVYSHCFPVFMLRQANWLLSVASHLIYRIEVAIHP